MSFDQDPMKALADMILRSTVASNARDSQPTIQAIRPTSNVSTSSDSSQLFSPTAPAYRPFSGGQAPADQRPVQVENNNNGPSLYGTPESLAAARSLARHRGSDSSENSTRRRGRVLSSQIGRAVTRRTPFASITFGTSSTTFGTAESQTSRSSPLSSLPSKRAASDTPSTVHRPKRHVFVDKSTAARLPATPWSVTVPNVPNDNVFVSDAPKRGPVPTPEPNAHTDAQRQQGKQPAIVSATQTSAGAISEKADSEKAGSSPFKVTSLKVAGPESAAPNAQPATFVGPGKDPASTYETGSSARASSSADSVTTEAKKNQAGLPIRSVAKAVEVMAGTATNSDVAKAAPTAELVAKTENSTPAAFFTNQVLSMLKQLTSRVAELERDNCSLRQDVEQLQQEADRRKFLGTDSAKAPYPVRVVLPLTEQTVVVQSTAQLKVNDLCRRAFMAAAIDSRRVKNPRLVLENSQLGHLQLLGECGVIKGTTVDLIYDSK